MYSKIEKGVLKEFDERDLKDGHFECPEIVAVGKNAFAGCEALISVNLSNAKSIGVNAFSACINLTAVTLAQAECIGEYAFIDCQNLNRVALDQAKDIGEDAFVRCSKLKSVTLAETTTIGKNAFSRCPELQFVIINNIDPNREIEAIRLQLPEDLQSKQIRLKTDLEKCPINKEVLENNLPADLYNKIKTFSIELTFFKPIKSREDEETELLQNIASNL
jgi:hypothetical protein